MFGEVSPLMKAALACFAAALVLFLVARILESYAAGPSNVLEGTGSPESTPGTTAFNAKFPEGSPARAAKLAEVQPGSSGVKATPGAGLESSAAAGGPWTLAATVMAATGALLLLCSLMVGDLNQDKEMREPLRAQVPPGYLQPPPGRLPPPAGATRPETIVTVLSGQPATPMQIPPIHQGGHTGVASVPAPGTAVESGSRVQVVTLVGTLTRVRAP